MGRPAVVRNNLTAGVLDPSLHDRYDFEAHSKGLADCCNYEVLPQGGLERRGGLRQLYRLRRKLLRVPVSASQATAPSGGSVAALFDQDTATTLVTAANSSSDVVARIDLGAATDIIAADVVGFSCASVPGDQSFGVETSLDGTTWSLLGRRLNVRSQSRTRRFAVAPGSTVSARYVRISNVNSAAFGAITVQGLSLWTEKAERSVVRRIPFTFDPVQTYVLVMTDRNVDVFRAGVWTAAIPVPHRADQLDTMTFAQDLDTLLAFHVEIQPHAIVRQGADQEWNSAELGFSNVPTVTAQSSFGIAQDEIQRLTVGGLAAGDTFAVLIEGQETVRMGRGTDAAALAAAVKSNLEALPAVDAGVVVGCTLDDDQMVLTITLAGGNGGRSWPNLSIDSPAAIAVAVELLQDGRPSTGALMSRQTGWPRCGTFFQGRFLCAGFKLRPDTLLFSMVGDLWNFTQNTDLGADAGIEFTLSSEQVPTIHHIFAGRHLQIFASNSEWWISDRVLDATQTTNFVRATSVGCRAGGELSQVEGSTLFVEQFGDVVRSFNYSDTEQNYTSESVTLFGSHLIKDAISLTYLRAASQREGSLVYVLDTDGSLVLITILRAQKVLAITRMQTNGGTLRETAVDAQRRIYWIVERTVGSQSDLYLEQLDGALLLDAATVTVRTVASTTVDVPAALQGRTLWVIADQWIEGPFTGAGATVTLRRPAVRVEVGIWTPATAETIGYRRVYPSGMVDADPHRIHTVHLSVQDTSSVSVGANGGAMEDVGLTNWRAVEFNVSLLDNPVTARVTVDRLVGYDHRPVLQLDQVRPGRALIRSIEMEIA